MESSSPPGSPSSLFTAAESESVIKYLVSLPHTGIPMKSLRKLYKISMKSLQNPYEKGGAQYQAIHNWYTDTTVSKCYGEFSPHHPGLSK